MQGFIDCHLAGHRGYFYKCKIDNNNILARISNKKIERQITNIVTTKENSAAV